jgi:hypothetical protein
MKMRPSWPERGPSTLMFKVMTWNEIVERRWISDFLHGRGVG